MLTWSCSDALSGVVAATITQTVSAEGEDQSATATCEDEAGNTASDTQDRISIDLTDPGIAFAGQDPAANGAGWNRTDVDLTWDCTDHLSGPEDPSVTETITGEGTDLSATGTCTDLAGNTASDAQGGVDIDRTDPGIVFEGQAPPANANGWNDGTVTPLVVVHRRSVGRDRCHRHAGSDGRGRPPVRHRHLRGRGGQHGIEHGR